MALPGNTALVLIDVQQGFDDPKLGKRNNHDAERHIVRLLAAWRQTGRPVIHVQHVSTEPDSPFRPERPGNAIKVEAMPLADEPLFQKQVNSAFIGTSLENYLRERGIQNLVLVGLTTDHCVSTSTRMAANLGFTVTVVADATATFDRVGHDGTSFDAEQVHQIALASLNGEFAAVRRTDELLSACTAPSAA